MTSDFQPMPAGRILLVEDDPDTARFISHVLGNRAGFDVEHAADPDAALPRLRAERWDLLITDIEMPNMTGIELLETVRLRAASLPVLVITAHASLDNTLGALRSRADDFMQKPLLPESLLATVAALIARGHAGREVVLAVGAHPDDVEIGAAGALLGHRAAGHDVTILTLSRGARGGRDSARADEARAAAQLLGAALYLEDLEDTRISEADPTISAISAVIEAVRPTTIYTHSIHDVHQDHRNTHQAVMVAAREVGSVQCFQSPSATVDFRPARFITIDGQIAGKLAAIGAFASQVAVRHYLEPDLIEATARYWSRFGGGRYAEAFEVVRDDAAAQRPAGTVLAAQEAAAPGTVVGGTVVGGTVVGDTVVGDTVVRERTPEGNAAEHIREVGHVTR
jgi:LmbE family N-acetylglucosaminyl deacetylase